MSRGPAASARVAARLLTIVVVGCLALTGCVFARPPAAPVASSGPSSDAPTGTPTSSASTNPAPTSPAPTTPAPTGSATAGPATPSRTPDPVERPVQSVPKVKPEGFVDPPPGRGLARYTAQELDWSSCGELECAKVKVPLDYADPDGQAITLALSRKRATQSPRIGSLFINPGGPGASGVDYVGYFDSEGLGRYDIVGWDPRGVGRSTPVTCFDSAALDDYLSRDASPDTPAEDAELQEREREFGRSCLARSGSLLQHVSTVETARDLDVLRAVVGDRKLTFLGSSYGTQIGATYAQLFARNVGRLVLDGAVNITDDTSISQAFGFERALTAFAAWCARQSCQLGDSKEQVLATIADLWRRLDERPMPGGRRPLTQQLGVIGVLYVLYENEDGWKYLLQALELAVVDKDPRYLLFLADGYHQRDRKTGTFGQLNFGFPAVRCLDSQVSDPAESRRRADADRAKAPILGAVNGPDYVCPMWPVAPAPKLGKITGAGAPPILVIGTTGDPATPYEYAQRMAKQLSSGVLVTYRGEGHLAYGSSSCVRRIVRDYLVRDEVPADGVTC